MRRFVILAGTAVLATGLAGAVWIQVRHGARPPVPTIEVDLPR